MISASAEEIFFRNFWGSFLRNYLLEDCIELFFVKFYLDRFSHSSLLEGKSFGQVLPGAYR